MLMLIIILITISGSFVLKHSLRSPPSVSYYMAVSLHLPSNRVEKCIGRVAGEGQRRGSGDGEERESRVGREGSERG